MRIGVVGGVIALGLLTAACGSNETQRSATGALTGIGVGAAVGGPIGAVVGAAVGGAGGAVMPEGADTIALNALHQEHVAGKNELHQAGLAPAASGTSEPPAETAQKKDQVRQAQNELKQQGLYKGKIDGIVGPQTRHALSAYQEREGLTRTATLDHQTLERLGLAAQPAAGNSVPPSATKPAPSNANAHPANNQTGNNDNNNNNQSGTSDNSGSSNATGNNSGTSAPSDTGQGTSANSPNGTISPAAPNSAAPNNAPGGNGNNNQ
jgi:hypothetical protein